MLNPIFWHLIASFYGSDRTVTNGRIKVTVKVLKNKYNSEYLLRLYYGRKLISTSEVYHTSSEAFEMAWLILPDYPL